LKKTILVLAILLLSCSLFGQREIPQFKPNYETKKSLHFGFTLGLNTVGFNFKRNASDVKIFADMPSNPAGFHVGIVTDLRLMKGVSLRFLPTVSFIERRVVFYDQKNEIYVNDANKVSADMKFESTFLEFPLLIKYKGRRINNYLPYVVFGAVPMLDLAAYKELNRDEGIYLRLKNFDLGYDIGVGIDYFLPYFKFSTELKFYGGLMNILSDDVITDPDVNTEVFVDAIQRMSTYGFKLSFHFE